MGSPYIELTSLPDAISLGQATTLDVLVKIIPPPSDRQRQRPRLNLAVVIDCSSSMAFKERLVYAKAAARQIVQELTPSDRISIHTFDQTAQTLLPSTFCSHKYEIINKIQTIRLGQGTNLHAGWIEGVNEVNKNSQSDTINRVILLSDGRTNRGITNQKTIVSHVENLAQSRISTTTVGLGNDFSDNLLKTMARGGGGNYYHLNSPHHLPIIFKKEVQALVATFGQAVTLGIEPQGDVDVEDVLNDFDLNPQGRFKLPNLVAGYPFNVVVQLKVEALHQQTDLCYFRLSWCDGETTESKSLRVPLRLPMVAPPTLQRGANNPEVQQQVALMLGARAKKKAIELVDRGNYEAAHAQLQSAQALILRAPASSTMELEIIALEKLEADLRERQFRQRSHPQAHPVTIGFDQTKLPWCWNK
ncbi:vWA domain-containing protein [Leptothoe kymatousa]|uniref:VWA domain-containing protein n=1 Tax=Leptothoe kymatousa TAU-MAC 1615 TaxID=2364775 RepID=A0ABS5Y6N5_9CYAN|nr:VWA domain-containing protein [Leptothoe kymatousa]MBT9313490.1 VWA domain-containing protein [Leptothoe kymatousa TAU-MAC 1615]